VSLNDYPTPRTEAETWEAGNLRIAQRVSADFARQLEREAAAWRAVADMYRKTHGVTGLDEADEAFDALNAELEKP